MSNFEEIEIDTMIQLGRSKNIANINRMSNRNNILSRLKSLEEYVDNEDLLKLDLDALSNGNNEQQPQQQQQEEEEEQVNAEKICIL